MCNFFVHLILILFLDNPIRTSCNLTTNRTLNNGKITTKVNNKKQVSFKLSKILVKWLAKLKLL